MERGEVAIVGGQFLALAVLILLLGNYAGTSGASTHIASAYWGPASGGLTLKAGTVNAEQTNASSISVYFMLASSVSVSPDSPSSPITAFRTCIDTTANNTGGVRIYTSIPISYNASSHQNYIVFGPTGQPLGIACSYTVSITDSLQQVVTWTATVKLVPPATQ